MPVETYQSTADDGLMVDGESLRERYRQERDRRVRDDGITQYVELAGQFAHLLDDPYARPIRRAAIAENCETAIIGGGLAGILAAAQLRQLHVEDIRIIEKGGDFGGTWYWNRYPGAACDVESYIYLPMLEELGYIPTEKYARAAEILAHAQAIARKFDLYRRVYFQTVVTECRWDEEQLRWTISTNRGDIIHSRHIILANGNFEKPKLPGIPGIESFEGKIFHTSRWDYSYTGGSAEGGLNRLQDKRVAIIGTGATAVQCIPHLAESAQHLYVFQRTPSPIGVRMNRQTDPQWAASLTPGWQQHRIESFTQVISGLAEKESEDLVSDGWTEIHHTALLISDRMRKRGTTMPDNAAIWEIADQQQMEELRARVGNVVTAKMTAEALKPYYNYFCKRPCFHDSYLQTYNRPNVTLVDTKGKGVERITKDAVCFGGAELPVDCVIYATGFEVGTDFSRRAGYEIIGHKGMKLSDKWRDGARTFHGMLCHGFPNCYIFTPSQTGMSINFTHKILEQTKHVAYIIGRCRSARVDRVEASIAAENAWVEECERQAMPRLKFFEECTPGYFNAEGKIGALNPRNLPYGGGPMKFFRILEEWRTDGTLRGLQLVASGQPLVELPTL